MPNHAAHDLEGEGGERVSVNGWGEARGLMGARAKRGLS